MKLERLLDCLILDILAQTLATGNMVHESSWNQTTVSCGRVVVFDCSYKVSGCLVIMLHRI